MSTRMDEEDWAHTLTMFRACLARRGRKGEDDRRFLEAPHFFTVENVRWRALPERFGNWNSVWKRFERLSKAGVFEAFFDTRASMSALQKRPSIYLVIVAKRVRHITCSLCRSISYEIWLRRQLYIAGQPTISYDRSLLVVVDEMGCGSRVGAASRQFSGALKCEASLISVRARAAAKSSSVTPSASW